MAAGDRAQGGAEHVAGGVAGEGKAAMGRWRWLLIGVLPLLAVGCEAVSSPLPEAGEAVDTPVEPTATLTVAPTSTPAAPTPTTVEVSPAITITIVYDNNRGDARLATAWGFACLVEGSERTVLFDTGADSATLLSNMITLGIDAGDVDAVVVSHVHGDHLGGLAGFLEQNSDVSVYLPQSFPQSTKDATTDAGAELIEVDGPVRICRQVLSTGQLGTTIKEQSLLVETSQGLVVITGCAHPGVVSIVSRAKELTGRQIHLVLGGFHLGGASEAEIGAIVDAFVEMGVEKVAPCHCSGDAARALFAEVYGDDFILTGAGSRLEVVE
jgi:7,8-dihydropterin-6-yl-methyl-4-(beta-D-ribofuranosyl)aminobenzene 5'-phosphate synthase